MNTYIFQDLNKEFTISVKKDFLLECPNPEKYTAHHLLLHYAIIKYFHNISGPAIIRHIDNCAEYWVNGEPVESEPNFTKEDQKRFFHNIRFNKKLDNL